MFDAKRIKREREIKIKIKFSEKTSEKATQLVIYAVIFKTRYFDDWAATRDDHKGFLGKLVAQKSLALNCGK